jgi:hypothetical protein
VIEQGEEPQSAEPAEDWEIQRGTAVFETHGDELQ